MAAQQDTTYTITPLPDPPRADFFDEAQWSILNALVDAVLPSITAKSSIADEFGQVAVDDHEFTRTLRLASQSSQGSVTEDAFRTFLAHRPSQDPEFADSFLRTLALVPPSQQKRLATVLTFMA